MDRRAFLMTPALAAARTASDKKAPAHPLAALPDLVREPDAVAVHRGGKRLLLTNAGTRWTSADIEVGTTPQSREHVAITLAAPAGPVETVALRWKCAFPAGCRFLGDHWERSYGDLEWRGIVPHRRMPWYFCASDGHAFLGVGVKTGAGSIACWIVDGDGVTLLLDVRSGGMGVELGSRLLDAATVVVSRGAAGQSAFRAARDFCAKLSPTPRMPARPVYGGNNWYYTYGENLSAAALLRDADLMAELAGAERNRPFMVLDMGYEGQGEGAGPASKTKSTFPDMPALTAEIKRRGVHPGIWRRPLLTVEKLPEGLRLRNPRAGGGIASPYFILDPSLPESLAYVEREVGQLREWGYELIKHDYSTFDITGRWGFEMAEDMCPSGWRFADRTRTTAEIVCALYAAIRKAAGDALVIGCNTIGHLGAGLFELQRIGDDTSGREWARTRKMGVNTLAFRLPQHGTFFAADADCVPITAAIPPRLTGLWLDIVSRSGTPLFVSVDPATISSEQKQLVRAAFARSARWQAIGLEPLDWMGTIVPKLWAASGQTLTYDWYDVEV